MKKAPEWLQWTVIAVIVVCMAEVMVATGVPHTLPNTLIAIVAGGVIQQVISWAA